MRKLVGAGVRALSTGNLTLLAFALALATLTAQRLDAQCYNPVPNQTPQLTVSPSYWAPGQNYTVTATNPQGNFIAGTFNPPVFVITPASYDLGSPMSAESANSHVVKSRFNDVGTASSTSGKVRIDLTELRVEAAGPYGKPEPERIVVLFEPESRAFSWYVVGEDSLATDNSRQTRALENERVVFFKGGFLVIFMGGTAPKLYVRDFRENAVSMDDAEERALIAAEQFHNPPDMQDEEKLWHTVMLKVLGLDFVLLPESEGGGLTPKVTSVQWDEDKQNWIVTMQARWKAQITLDADYNLVSTKKVR